MQGLNLRLQPCKGCTLPTELIARKTGELISTGKNCVKQKLVLFYINEIFSFRLKILMSACLHAETKNDINGLLTIQLFKVSSKILNLCLKSNPLIKDRLGWRRSLACSVFSSIQLKESAHGARTRIS